MLASAPSPAFAGSTFEVNANLIIDDTNITGMTYTSPVHLTPGHVYTWYAGSVSKDGTPFWNPTAASFTLGALAAPTASSPNGSVSAASSFDTPTFTWTAVTGADHYYLYATDNNLGGALVVNVPSVSGTTYALTTAQALTPGHIFTWHVYAVSTNGQGYTESAAQTFTLAGLAAPIQSGPSGSSTNAIPTFIWSAVLGSQPLLPLRRRRHGRRRCHQQSEYLRDLVHTQHRADRGSSIYLVRLRLQHQ